MQAKYDQLTMKNRSERLVSQTEVSVKTNLAAGEVAKVLGISAAANCLGTEVSEKQIAVTGRVTFSVCYETPEGEIRKTECGTELAAKIEDERIPAAGKAQVQLFVDKADAELSSVLVVNAAVGMEGYVVTNVTAQYLSGGEDIVCRTEEISFDRAVGGARGTYTIDEEFELNYGVREVLLHDAKVIVTGAQCGIGAIVADGICILTMSLLQNIENSDILLERRVFPFRLEAECPEAMPNFAAFARGAGKSVKLDITVDEQTGKSTVLATMGIELDCEAYENALVSVASDAYLPDKESALTRETYQYDLPAGGRQFTERMTLRGALRSELPQGARLMSCGLVRLNLFTDTQSGFAVEGSVEGKAFVKDPENKVTAITFEAPFRIEPDYAPCEGEKVSVDGGVEEMTARIASSEEIELSITARIVVSGRKKAEFAAITDVAEGAPREVNHSAISVYIPAEGEDLWTVSKKLNACPEAIMQYNPDLTFPLTGGERILIYRQIIKDY